MPNFYISSPAKSTIACFFFSVFQNNIKYFDFFHEAEPSIKDEKGQSKFLKKCSYTCIGQNLWKKSFLELLEN